MNLRVVGVAGGTQPYSRGAGSDKYFDIQKSLTVGVCRFAEVFNARTVLHDKTCVGSLVRTRARNEKIEKPARSAIRKWSVSDAGEDPRSQREPGFYARTKVLGHRGVVRLFE